MPEEKHVAAENKENAEAIERADAVREVARGNVHSEAEPGQMPGQDGPPPLPN